MTMTSRTLSVLALLSVASIALAEKVNLHLPATSVENAVSALAKLSGQKLSASPTLGRDVVFLDVQGVEPTEIMDQLASALNATWVEVDGTKILTRGSALQREEEAAERTTIQNLIESYLKKAQEAPAEAPKEEAMTGPGGEEVRFTPPPLGLSNASPSGKFLQQALAGMDKARLARELFKGRSVWSTSPSQMQNGLPGSLLAAADKYLQDTRAEREKSGNTGFNMDTAMNRPIPPVDAKVARVMIIMDSVIDDFGVSVRGMLFDKSGQVLSTFFDFVNFNSPKPSDRLLKWNDGKPIVWSDLSKSLLKKKANDGAQQVMGIAIAVAGGDGTRDFMFGMTNPYEKFDQQYRARLLRPDLEDPLSFFVSEGLKQSAEAHGIQVVAVLPDTLLGDLAGQLNSQKELKTNEFLAMLERNSDLNVELKDDWFRIVPKLPSIQREQRFDRKALARVFGVLESTSNLPLNDVANYALTSKGRLTDARADSWLSSRLFPNGSKFWNGLWAFNGDALRFYGSLSPGQRSQAQNGQPIPISKLSSDQRGHLHQLLYFSMDGPMPSETTQPGGPPRRRMGMAGGGGMMSIFEGFERTDKLPNGVPGTGTVTFNFGSETSVLASAADENKVMSVRDLAMNRLEQEGGIPWMTALGSTPFKPTAYKTVQQLNISFTVKPTEDTSLSRRFEEFVIDPKAASVDYKQLPVPLRNAVDAEYRRTREMFRNIRVNIGGREAVIEERPSLRF